MQHQDHVNLIRKGVAEAGGTWAELGSGAGAFTLALAELIGPRGTIYSADKNQGSLREQEQEMRVRYPATTVQYLVTDFTRHLDLPPLDGVLMANSLHYVKQKDALLQQVRGYLKPGGRFLLVEYDADRGNPWVPYPLSYRTWESLARKNGFASTQRLASVPSRFLGSMYSALSMN